jgi:hypothetical protein
VALPTVPRAFASVESAPVTMSGAEKRCRKRYRPLDQARVNGGEQRRIANLLDACHLSGGSLLDLPCSDRGLILVCSRVGMTTAGSPKITLL